MRLLKKSKNNYKTEFNLLNKNKNNISESNEQISMEIENLSSKYNFININKSDFELYILAISKLNKYPIYLKNTDLKNIILKKIIESFNKKIKKNIVEKILLYKIDYKIDKYFTLSNNNVSLIGINETKNVNNIYNNIKEENKNKNNKNYLINNNSKSTLNESENIIIKYINDILINKYKIYKNLLDFYISHFIDFNINIDLLISNLKFIYINESIDIIERTNFEERFKILLRSLSYDELRLFNLCISGSYLNQQEYKIEINNTNKKSLPVFHTCFNQMDINDYKNFFFYFINFYEFSPY
jgi:hypothetical protein